MFAGGFSTCAVEAEQKNETVSNDMVALTDEERQEALSNAFNIDINKARLALLDNNEAPLEELFNNVAMILMQEDLDARFLWLNALKDQSFHINSLLAEPSGEYVFNSVDNANRRILSEINDFLDNPVLLSQRSIRGPQ